MHSSPRCPVRLTLGRCALAALAFAALVPAARAQTQDLFVSNYSTNTILRFAATGPGTFSTTPTALTAPSLNAPDGLAFDARGDLFVSNIYGGSITKFASTGGGTFGAGTVAETRLNSPTGLAFDANGDLFVANSSGNTIVEFLATGVGTFGATRTLSGGLSFLNFPQGLAFDANGDLFVANQSGNITEFASAGAGTFGTPTTLVTGPTERVGLAFDAGGDLFATTYNNTVTEFIATGIGTFGTTTSLSGGLSVPQGLAFDANGDLFVISAGGNGTITEFASTGAGTFGPAAIIETGLSGPESVAFGQSTVPALVSLTFPSPVPGGSVVTATVTLSGPAQSDTVVGLSSSDSSVVRLSRAVLIPAGSSSVTFAINTFRSHTTDTVTINAALGAVTESVPLTITGR